MGYRGEQQQYYIVQITTVFRLFQQNNILSVRIMARHTSKLLPVLSTGPFWRKHNSRKKKQICATTLFAICYYHRIQKPKPLVAISKGWYHNILYPLRVECQLYIVGLGCEIREERYYTHFLFANRG